MWKWLAAAFLVVAAIVALGSFGARLLFRDETKTTTPSPLGPTGGSEEIATRGISVVSVAGAAERRFGNAEWTALTAGDGLQLDEAIRTGQDGHAVLDVGNVATVDVAARSEVAVREISRTVARVRVAEGRIGAVVRGKQGVKLKVEVSGSEAVAETEEGAFDLLSDGKGKVAVATRSGRVRLSAKNKTVEVASGNESVVNGDLPPSAPTPVPASLFLKVGAPPSRMQREKSTTIKGQTAPGVVVSVNGVRTATDEKGAFAATVDLAEGENPVVVEAEDASGRTKRVDLPSVTVKSAVAHVKSTARWGEKAKKSKIKW